MARYALIIACENYLEPFRQLMSPPKDARKLAAILKSQKVGFETFFRTGDDMVFINSVLPEWSGVLPTTAIYDSKGKLIKMIQAKIDKQTIKTYLKDAYMK